jgi:quercetin dioxygenase-like cupin family protein
MKKLFLTVAILAFAGSALAQDAMKVVTPEALTWKDHPALPKGAQFAVLVGDRTKAEVFVIRVKVPPNYQIPPHTHPSAQKSLNGENK